jgi:predicted alpha/beta hydrolase family esterase
MKTIVLPGFSPHNKTWAYEVKNKLNLDEIVVLDWLHWERKVKSFFREKELARIKNLIGGKKVNIIAKSIGTGVIVGLIPEVRINLEKIILCGIPLRGFGDKAKRVFRQNLPLFSSKNMVVFQNENDPLGKYEEVKDFLEEINPKIKIIKKQRSDHEYPYFKDFENFLKE